jgi:hypothetical protein
MSARKKPKATKAAPKAPATLRTHATLDHVRRDIAKYSVTERAELFRVISESYDVHGAPATTENCLAFHTLNNVAKEVLRGDLEEIVDFCDQIDKTLISVFATLSEYDGLTSTVHELTKIAQASYCIRPSFPSSKGKAVTP